MDAYATSVLTNIGLMSFPAISAYVVLASGELSLGQQAYFGAGAYVGAAATVMFKLPLLFAMGLAAMAGGLGAGLIGMATLRLSGIYFSLLTLAVAEIVRLCLELLDVQVQVPGGRMAGPRGIGGFGGIRYAYENHLDPVVYLVWVYSALVFVIVCLMAARRARLMLVLRCVGADPELAAGFGIDIHRARMAACIGAGMIAALGGALFAHYATYIEPANFDVMLGIHSLTYCLIGGLASVFGPLLGVCIDVVLLQASGFLAAYRMIVFGGLVALMLIVKPRGILDERTCAVLARMWRRARGGQ